MKITAERKTTEVWTLSKELLDLCLASKKTCHQISITVKSFIELDKEKFKERILTDNSTKKRKYW